MERGTGLTGFSAGTRSPAQPMNPQASNVRSSQNISGSRYSPTQDWRFHSVPWQQLQPHQQPSLLQENLQQQACQWPHNKRSPPSLDHYGSSLATSKTILPPRNNGSSSNYFYHPQQDNSLPSKKDIWAPPVPWEGRPAATRASFGNSPAHDLYSQPPSTENGNLHFSGAKNENYHFSGANNENYHFSGANNESHHFSGANNGSQYSSRTANANRHSYNLHHGSSPNPYSNHFPQSNSCHPNYPNHPNYHNNNNNTSRAHSHTSSSPTHRYRGQPLLSPSFSGLPQDSETRPGSSPVDFAALSNAAPTWHTVSGFHSSPLEAFHALSPKNYASFGGRNSFEKDQEEEEKMRGAMQKTADLSPHAPAWQFHQAMSFEPRDRAPHAHSHMTGYDAWHKSPTNPEMWGSGPVPAPPSFSPTGSDTDPLVFPVDDVCGAEFGSYHQFETFPAFFLSEINLHAANPDLGRHRADQDDEQNNNLVQKNEAAKIPRVRSIAIPIAGGRHKPTHRTPKNFSEEFWRPESFPDWQVLPFGDTPRVSGSLPESTSKLFAPARSQRVCEPVIFNMNRFSPPSSFSSFPITSVGSSVYTFSYSESEDLFAEKDENSEVAVPPDMARQILSFCDIATLSKCVQVCKIWRGLVDDSAFWRQRFREDFGEAWNNWYWDYEKSHHSHIDWKTEYKKEFLAKTTKDIFGFFNIW